MRALAAIACVVLAGCSSDPAPADGGYDATLGDGATTDATASDIAVDVPPRVYPMPTAGNAVPPTDPRWEGQYR